MVKITFGFTKKHLIIVLLIGIILCAGYALAVAGVSHPGGEVIVDIEGSPTDLQTAITDKLIGGDLWEEGAEGIYNVGKVGIGSPPKPWDGSFQVLNSTGMSSGLHTVAIFANGVPSEGSTHRLAMGYVSDGTNVKGSFIKHEGSGGSLSLGGNLPSQGAIFIDANGNVGIGTTTPAAMLNVNGNVLIGTGSGSASSISFEQQTGFHRIAFNELRFWDWGNTMDIVTFNNRNVEINNGLRVGGRTNCNGAKKLTTDANGWLTCEDDQTGGGTQVLGTSGNQITLSGGGGSVTAPYATAAGSATTASTATLATSANSCGPDGTCEMLRLISDYAGENLFRTGDTYLYIEPVANTKVRLGAWDSSSGSMPVEINKLNIVDGITSGTINLLSTSSTIFYSRNNMFFMGYNAGYIELKPRDNGGGVGEVRLNGNTVITGTLSTWGTKNFDIAHPDVTKAAEGWRLKHAAIESPEVRLYYEGKGKIKNGVATITLPSYFDNLIVRGTEIIHLTELSRGDVWVEEENYGNNLVRLKGEEGTEFSWLVSGVRIGFEDYTPEYKEN